MASDPNGTFTDIRGATSATYTPVFNDTDDAKNDVGKNLRAIATYSDGHDGNNMAMMDSALIGCGGHREQSAEVP